MTIRPIFVIRLHENISDEAYLSNIANLKHEMPDLFEQYHVLFASGENRHAKFECYNIKDIPEDIRKKTNGLILDIITKKQF